MVGNFRFWCAFASVALVLGGCAETKLAIHTAKLITAPSEKEIAQARGVYKVGKPYRIMGIWYYPAVDYNYSETGIASWYGSQFHGKRTANGEIFDMNKLSAAHRTLPLPSRVRVTNLRNGRSISLRVNDRGPFARGRIIDLSRRTAQLLGFERQGTTPVRVEIIAAESRQLAAIARRGSAGPVVMAKAPSDAVRVETLTPLAGKPATQGRLGQPAAANPDRGGSAAAPPPRLRPAVITVPVKPANLFVQAGSFIRYRFAERMRRKLSAIGPTRISQAVVGRYKFYRVRVGPLASVKDGDRVLDHVIAYGYPDARLIVD